MRGRERETGRALSPASVPVILVLLPTHTYPPSPPPLFPLPLTPPPKQPTKQPTKHPPRFAALIAMAAYLNKFGFIPWFSNSVVDVVAGLGLTWQPAFGVIVLLYFYSHYFFASGGWGRG